MKEQLILSGENSLEQLNRFLSDRSYSSFHVLVDSNTKKYCLTVLIENVPILKSAGLIEVHSGEQNKNLSTSEFIVNQLLANLADRNALLVNLGGGMITDLGGFTASVYKRGIDFINVPTSLMGMVDASIGGKTAVNSSDVKNVIGSFAMPEGVFIYPPFLRTLPERELKSAFPEIIKHVLLSDEKKWNQLVSDPVIFFSKNNLNSLIEHSSQFKRSIVGDDLFDSGIRKSLNFGHTIGHAIESLSLKGHYPLLHGEAIAYGMVAEAFLSAKLASLDEATVNQLKDIFINLFSTNKINCSTEDLMELIRSDKKNKKDAVAFALIKAPGKYAGIFFPEAGLITASIDYMLSAFVDNSQLVDDDN